MPKWSGMRVHCLAYNAGNLLAQLPNLLSKFSRLVTAGLQLSLGPITVILKSSNIIVLSLVFGDCCINLACI